MIWYEGLTTGSHHGLLLHSSDVAVGAMEP
jgi:hypothetical protein